MRCRKPGSMRVRQSRPSALILGLGSAAACAVGYVPLATAQTTIFEEPLSQRVANYDIKVTLDDAVKHINAEMVLTWNNPSDDAIEDLQFHLYANAFKNTKSTWIREVLRDRGRRPRSEPIELPWEDDDGWGWIRITSMMVDGADVTERIEFFQPDDDNADDQSVIRVPLPEPIAPRGSARIEIEFESRIPQCNVRTGWWADDFFMMVHWFPKIGVYEPPGTRFVPADAPRGRWNCHQFHAGTEFYADYGVYDVQITLPTKYVVGTSGLIVDQRKNGDGTKTVVAHAEDVHEFAWVADAQFREASAIWVYPDTGRQIDIRLLFQPDHESVRDKYISATKGALSHVHEWLGPDAYPYPNITVVDPRKGSGAGGMEYPNLFTGGAIWWFDKLIGEGGRITEGVTIHEFMHQIWYGIVGSNEFEEAWLDEGLATYSSSRIMDELFGPTTSIVNWWGASAGGVGLSQAGYAIGSMKDDGAIAEPTFAHWHRGVGSTMAYHKSGLVLQTLENYLGRERFDQIMRTYFDRWKFRHPCRDDFIAVANEMAGENLDWFFDQVIDQPTSLDYAVASISNVPLESYDEGLNAFEPRPKEVEDTDDEEDEEDEEAEEDEDEDKPHRSVVVFRRVGEVIFPMDVEIEFSDGEIVREVWDGRDRVKVYRFSRPAKVARAAIDPDYKVPLDVDPLNNSLRVEKEQQVANKYTAKGLFWMQSLLQFISILG